MERAIKNLCQLSDKDFFEEISTGIDLIIQSVRELHSASRRLRETDSHRAARVLRNLAEEEASKALILVDAVRCPTDRQEEKSRTLGYFYNHLAKGIYAEVAKWKPADFAEISNGIQSLRKQYYLDGPSGIDWIFPSRIIQSREDNLYVGYVRSGMEDGGTGECYWSGPNFADQVDKTLPFLRRCTPPMIVLAQALHETNATKPDGLAIVASVWRSANLRRDLRFTELEKLNYKTLETMEHEGLLSAVPRDACATVRRLWMFPLWPLDLSMHKVKKNDLRELQHFESPEWY